MHTWYIGMDVHIYKIYVQSLKYILTLIVHSVKINLQKSITFGVNAQIIPNKYIDNAFYAI